ncbi:PREDICTED: peroxisomal targeting signal 1 receptor [Ceratosolen solmsi marchali]|uniref:Peroxisomal targeting signal 1 receptor n=1 Tax=Ceratosolen solmsi marchali TaxID=326594 RepID=A0AAJ6YH71_9HYME|nr:PREDICTED: peroxisomal targeting signal 1 receptor [Ceratosolen solmsi marchali]XP_011498020.1 PREDICTED: peroxisomal targeting signal 1 receptor [Ceratosolen solmsi marchali]XP_011498021.1 PREDICTED: peroxisomal targeting signal 1 receptor [Ceratosolen solmsi marchali]
MALRELVEGDCGGPNPLIRLTSHFVKDHGLKEEGVRDLFGSIDPFETGNSDQLVKQFLEESSVHPQTFKMENILQEMREIDQSIYPPVTAPGVVEELTNQDTAWANQYLQSGGHFQENHKDDIWNVQPIASNAKVAFPGETHELGLGPKWAEEYLEHSIDHPEAATAKSENPDFAYSKFMKFMRQEGDLPIEAAPSPNTENLDNNWTANFTETADTKPSETTIEESKGDETHALSTVDEQSALATTWTNEFSKNKSTTTEQDAENYKSSFWESLQSEWEKISGENVTTNHPWISEYDNFYDPFKEYAFSEENPMSNLLNPLEEGKRRLEIGDLPGAVLCFEAAVNQDSKNTEAWLLLGKTQAENEQDPLAISALKQCLTLDPSNLTALMTLAVSYTNESYQSQACLTLKDWLLKNEKYKHLKASKSPENLPPQLLVSTILFNDIHNEVKDLFIQAARMQPHGTIDADVQCGLGVLFNLSSEYDKASDCFRAAIQARPKDPMLWNRLGAILANGQRSEEAIDAYHQALELSPGFIRARYNLGISCINLNAYKEAGEHLLTALNQQAAGKGVSGERAPMRIMSDTIWSTLRLVLSLMHKYHLNDAIENRDLARLNKEFEME